MDHDGVVEVKMPQGPMFDDEAKRLIAHAAARGPQDKSCLAINEWFFLLENICTHRRFRPIIRKNKSVGVKEV